MSSCCGYMHWHVLSEWHCLPLSNAGRLGEKKEHTERCPGWIRKLLWPLLSHSGESSPFTPPHKYGEASLENWLASLVITTPITVPPEWSPRTCSNGTHHGLDGEVEGVVPSTDDKDHTQGLRVDIEVILPGLASLCHGLVLSPNWELLNRVIKFLQHMNHLLIVGSPFILERRSM